MSEPIERLLNLGGMIRTRRDSLRLSIAKAAKAADLGTATWRRAENGRPVQGGTYAGVESALRWQSGDCRRYLDHGLTPRETGSGTESSALYTEELAPGVRELALPEDLQGHLQAGPRHRILELSMPGEKGSMLISWSEELPEDLVALRDELIARQRVFARLARARLASGARPPLPGLDKGP